jgi:multiple sugar transport system ATP-binding protein
MDEPLSNLDAKLRVQMRTEVSRIQQRLGTTTVYVTHDQTEAMTLGDRVAVMRAGLLQQVDTPKELYNHPRNIFVAGFIGSPSMNFFTAHVENEKVRLPFGEVDLPQGVQAGGEVIAGIRPEDFEDASLVGDLPHHLTFDAPIDLVESMGSEIYAFFPVEAPAAQSDELAELAADSGLADVPSAGGEEAQVVARLAPESEVKEGSKARLALDATKLHLFDPSDGSNIAHRGG